MTTSVDIKVALRRHYNGKRSNGPGEGEQYVIIEEARSGKGWDGNNGQCDLLAINSYQSRGLDIIGHEIKVSRSDWNNERDNPDKAERFARYCRRWYVVVPTLLADKMSHEVPPAWGLKVVSDKGTVTERQRPQVREPEQPPWSWWVGWLAQIDRQHKRDVPRQVERLLADERQAMRASIAERVQQQLALEDRGRSDALAHLNERIAMLAKETGIDLRRAWAPDLKKLGELWRLSGAGLDLGLIVTHLRQAADKLDGALTASRIEAGTESAA